MKNIFAIFNRVGSSINEDETPMRYKLYTEAKAFLLSGKYTQYKSAELFLRHCFKETKNIATIMKIEPSSIHQIRKRLTEDFYRVVGEGLVVTMEFGTETEAKAALRELSLNTEAMHPTEMFSNDIISLIQSAGSDSGTFEIGDCKYELTLLWGLSHVGIKRLMANVDADRLLYILDVIEGKKGTPRERAITMQVLNSDDLLKHAKPEDKKKFTFPPVRPDDEF